MPSSVVYDHKHDIFAAIIPYADRRIVATLGYKWHPVRKRWETQRADVAKATPFEKHVTASRQIAGLEADFERAIDASEATSADDFDVPVPEGLSYLPYQKAGIRYAYARRRCLIADEPGLGKGHPLWYRLLTPTGLKAIGDLKVGDDVIGSDGKPTYITAVHDRGILPVFTATLNDGVTVPVDGDHLWKVRALPRRPDSVWQVLDTATLRDRIAAGESFEIPLISGPASVHGQADELDAAAWGAWVAKPSLYTESVTARPISDILKMPASYRQRFLWGYLKTCAQVIQGGCLRVVVYEGKNATSVADVIPHLVRSVGGLVFWDSGYTNAFAKQTLLIWLPEPQARAVLGLIRPKQNNRRLMRAVLPDGIPPRSIVAIEPYSREQVRCISVAAADRLYVTEGHVVTHNTVQAIGVANVCRSVKRVLVLCPASLKVNWQREWSKWQTRSSSIGIAGGAIESYKCAETGKRKVRSVPFWPDTDVVICNYDIAAKFSDQILAEDWDLLVCDEAHGLKSKDAARSKIVFGFWDRKIRKMVKGITADRVLYLTGTPIVNRPADLWNLVKSCDPDGLGRDWMAYAYEYCAGEKTNFGFKAEGASNLKALHRALRAKFMVRRRKDDVLKELPPKSRQVIVLPADGLRSKVDAEQDAMTAALAQYEAELGIRSNEALTIDDLAGLVARFRKVDYDAYADELETSGGPVEETPVTDLARARADLALMKVPMVVEHVRLLLETESKVILFAWHKPVIQALREAFPGCASISGDTSASIRKDGSSARQDQVDRFQTDPDCHVFVGQIQAAGVGHTLTAARVVVFAELDWVPGNVTQAEDRAHRIGQLDHVLVQHLVVENSLDDKVVQSLIVKQGIISEALDGKDPTHDQQGNGQGSDRRRDPEAQGPGPGLPGAVGAPCQAREDHVEVAAHPHPHGRAREIAPPRRGRAPQALCRDRCDVRRFDNFGEQA